MSVWVQVHILSVQRIAYKGLGKFALADKERKLEYCHRTELVFFKQAEMVLHLTISSKKRDRVWCIPWARTHLFSCGELGVL